MERLVLPALALTVVACANGAAVSDSFIWQPPPGTTWQWQLTGAIDDSPDVEMYDVDLFDTPVETIRALRGRGRVVVCYFSAGSVEDWRPDAAAFPDEAVGDPLEGWPGERWLDVRAIEALAPVLTERLDLAVEKGCDGVEPDNVDSYLTSTGFDIEPENQLAFNRWLADEAHARGLSIGLKNDLPQARELVDWFDWLLVEECVEFDECAGVAPFMTAGKAVFGAEYQSMSLAACAAAAEFGISLIFKDPGLGPWVEHCA